MSSLETRLIDRAWLITILGYSINIATVARSLTLEVVKMLNLSEAERRGAPIGAQETYLTKVSLTGTSISYTHRT